VRANLLVIDDLAVLTVDPAQAKLAFWVVSERYENRRSIAITTNRPFKDWPNVFPDALNAQVIANASPSAPRPWSSTGGAYRDPR
jgi:DNA replication protein DnaC